MSILKSGIWNFQVGCKYLQLVTVLKKFISSFALTLEEVHIIRRLPVVSTSLSSIKSCCQDGRIMERISLRHDEIGTCIAY